MIRLLDLPGLPAIEARVRLNALTATRQDWDLVRMVEAFTSDVLGIQGNPGVILWDALAAEDEDEIEDDADNDDEVPDVELWRQDGWDVRGEDGKELVCLTLIEDALEVVEAGLAPRSKVELEAMIWTARKEAETKPPARERARNQDFLQLGQRRRRGA